MPARAPAAEGSLELRLWTIPEADASDPRDEANVKVIELFKRKHPEIVLRKAVGIKIPQIGSSAALLMSIAGGIAPDVLEMQHEDLQNFITQGFLVPLDDYVSDIPEAELYKRAPKQLWDAARFRGADGKDHLYAIPFSFGVSALKVRHDLLNKLGYDRSKWPRTWDELHALAQDICAKSEHRGFGLPKGPAVDQMTSAPADLYQTILVGVGGEPWRRDAQGRLQASFDDEKAVEAMDILWKLANAQWQRDGRSFEGVSHSDVEMWTPFKRGRYVMALTEVRGELGLLAQADTTRFRLLPMPAAADGTARPRLVADYAGLFAGQKNEAIRRAAFDFVMTQSSREARRIVTETLVAAESGINANPLDLEEFGFHDQLAMLPEGYVEFYKRALAEGYVTPAGAGADELRRALAKPLQLVLVDRSLASMSDDARRGRIRQILQAAVQDVNRRLHQTVSDTQVRQRKNVAMVLAIAIFAAFIFQLWLAQRTYAAKLGVGLSSANRGRGWNRSMKITLALVPALAMVALWEYYPLVRGTIIAFQDYRFLEGTRYAGLNNFSHVLFSEAFWLAMGRTLQYTVLSLGLGFVAPVFLAILLHELPRGTVFFRILYYLPSLTTGIVVIFLWKSFFDPGPNGLINYLLSFVRIAPQKWLDDPNLAMLCCVLPTVWAGMGVGSLIYLAALKSIPVELFEAASLDGCSFWGKVRHVAVPFLKPLMIINLVGVLVGTFQSSGYILVLTGGGPSDATNVVSLEIFYEAYARLSFGTATAMSWILAFALIGFTLFQIRYLARLEFRSAGAAA